jgi:hydroxypyruvate isomerase
MIRFSANLGFLWADLPLIDAIYAAKRAGFAAVECHWPYATPATDVARALTDTGLPMLGLNTPRGNLDLGENGLAAVPGREADAHAAIQQAITYGAAIDARAVHVMAGLADGPKAHQAFTRNLHMACDMAAAEGMTILIEPLNQHDAPGYFLRTTEQARALIAEVAAPNLKLMFDCYHVGRSEGDIVTRLQDLQSIIGHIQFASVPDRTRPDQGEVDYHYVFSAIAAMQWSRPIGAEYKTAGNTDETLGWMRLYEPAAPGKKPRQIFRI